MSSLYRVAGRQHYLCICTCLVSVLSLKSSVIAQSPAKPTTVKIMRLKSAPCPPKIKPTRSSPKSPMEPQLSAPTITNIKAIVSMYITSFHFVSVHSMSNILLFIHVHVLHSKTYRVRSTYHIEDISQKGQLPLGNRPFYIALATPTFLFCFLSGSLLSRSLSCCLCFCLGLILL